MEAGTNNGIIINRKAPEFYAVSLDFFRPFEMRGETNKGSRGKVYGIIINCLVSRAV